jgi:hypothetical protein
VVWRGVWRVAVAQSIATKLTLANNFVNSFAAFHENPTQFNRE